MEPDALVACPGCGLRTPRSDGPTHAYIGASPGCWERYTDLLGQGRGGQLAVDTYAAQHPGVPGRRSSQSVAVHLISICALLERRDPRGATPAILRAAVGSQPTWPWIVTGAPVGRVDVDDVVTGRRSVREWAETVWAAYQPHHELVRGWVAGLPP